MFPFQLVFSQVVSRPSSYLPPPRILCGDIATRGIIKKWTFYLAVVAARVQLTGSWSENSCFRGKGCGYYVAPVGGEKSTKLMSRMKMSSLSLSPLLSKCLGARRTRVQGSQGRRGTRRGNTYAKRVHARGALVRAAMKFSTPLLSLQRELHAIPAALFSVRAIRRLDRVDFSAPPDSPFPIRSISLAPRSMSVRIYN